MKRFISPLVLTLLFFSVLAGCDSMDASQDETVPVSLSLTVVDGADSVSGAAFNGGDLQLAKSDHVTISSARILVREIQFHARDGEDDDAADGTDDTGSDDADSDDDADDDVEEEGEAFRTERMVLELNLDGNPTEVEIAEIPVGTYHKVSFRVHKPEEGENLAGTEFEEFKDGDDGQERYSIIVEGSIGDTTFVYRSNKAFQQKVHLDPDLAIDSTFAGPLNVALEVDISEWFVSRNGEELDPNTDSDRVRSAIDKSIRDSFRAFPDHDRDGRRQNVDRGNGNGGGNGNGNGGGSDNANRGNGGGNGNAGGNGNSGGNGNGNGNGGG